MPRSDASQMPSSAGLVMARRWMGSVLPFGGSGASKQISRRLRS